MTPLHHLFDDIDADHDDVGKKPKKKKQEPERLPGVWDNCHSGFHQLCAVEVLVNGTLDRKKCECKCHASKAN